MKMSYNSFNFIVNYYDLLHSIFDCPLNLEGQAICCSHFSRCIKNLGSMQIAFTEQIVQTRPWNASKSLYTLVNKLNKKGD